MDTSDVDMVDAGLSSVSAGSHTDRTPMGSDSRPPSSRSASSTPEPLPALDAEQDSGSETESDSDDDGDGDGAPPEEAAGAVEEKPTSAAGSGSGPEASHSVPTRPPQRKRHPRAPSPVPPPPTPLTTIRLDIKIIAGSEDYEIDIIDLAKASGQRPASPKAAKVDSSDTEDAEGDDEADHQTNDAPTAKPKRRRRKSEWYDLDDDFIDDRDLALDDRKTIAQTKQAGFYVSSGDVQLVRDKTPAKTGKYKLPLFEISKAISSSGTVFRPRSENGAGPSRSREEGTKDAPIALLSDGEDKKRKAEESVSGRAKKRRTELRPFSSELQAAIDNLKVQVDKEKWETKGKFPNSIKPILKDVAIKAIESNEYDDNFFNLMPRIFIYNRFTMTKLVKRLVCADHVRILNERQDALIEQLSKVARDTFEQAQADHQRAIEQWERKQERKAEGVTTSLSNGTDSPNMQGTPKPISAAFPSALEDPDAPPPGTQMAVDGEAANGKDQKYPEKRYKLNDDMKKLIWELVCISNECARLENEKNELEGNKTKPISDQGYRKVLYQKIVQAYPEGWMTSGQISREVSLLKKRAEKEALEIEGFSAA